MYSWGTFHIGWTAIGSSWGTRRAQDMANHPAMRTPGALREINARQLEQARLPVERSASGRDRVIG